MTYQEIIDKLKRLLTSRKFWTLVGSLVTIWGAYLTGEMPLVQAVTLTVGALAVFSTGVAIEDGLRAQGSKGP